MQEKRSAKLITEIQVNPMLTKNGRIGFCSFIFANSLKLTSIAIYPRRSGGYRLVYPTQKKGSKNFPYFYPINQSITKELELQVSLAIKKLGGKK